MNKRIIIKMCRLFIFVIFTTQIFADPPDWEVNPAAFEYNATLVAAVVLDDDYMVQLDDPEDILAAIEGGQSGIVLGIATQFVAPFGEYEGDYIYEMTIYGNGPGQFMYYFYDASRDTILTDATGHIREFEPNEQWGDLNNVVEILMGGPPVWTPSLFYHHLTSVKAFYFFGSVTIDNEPIEPLDWVAAFNGDICVGASQWDTSQCGEGVCELAIYGEDGQSTYTEGYMQTGEIPTFKIYDLSENEYFDAYPSEDVPWYMETMEYIENLRTEENVTILVSHDGSGDFPTIQEGIDAAYNGDIVRVFSGTYSGANNIDLNFYGKAITLISEAGPESTIIDCGDTDRGFTFENGEIATSVLDGFTIINGNRSIAAGIYCSYSSPKIINCIVTSCSADQYGGGMYLMYSNPILKNMTFSDNTASYFGGGMDIGTDSSPKLINVTFSGNSCTNYGFGGGISIESTTNPTLTNVTFSGNSANGGWGGGIFFNSYSNATLTNVTFSGNSAYAGGGMNINVADPITLTNVTFSDNTASNGGGMYVNDSNPILTNSIIWGNSPQEIYTNSTINISYSDIQGGWEGEGNIDLDPLFVDPENGDVSLQEGSPCIDAGTTDIDMDGFSDIFVYNGSAPDIGAIEYVNSDVGHFLPPYLDFSYNPYLPMTFYVSSAQFGGINLVNGDEIGIFDDNICVGFGVVDETISQSNLLQISASGQDLDFPDNTGFTPGNGISYRYWDASSGTEISQVFATYLDGNEVFTNLGTALITLFGEEDACSELGDLNGDTGFNVLDIVTLANCVLDENCETLEFGCASDVNGDTYYNVLDIVTLANCVLNEDCSGRVDDASYSKLIISDNIVLIEADGFIGGVQMTLQHGDDFTIEMTDRALFADYLTSGNETRLLVITPETDKLFSFSGDFEIAEIIVANSQHEVSVDLPLATSYSLSEAYPNPFNPTTTLSFALPIETDVSLSIYNLQGRLVSNLISGSMKAGYHSVIWNANQYSSGMYFVKMIAGNYVKNQKLMLVK